MLYVGWDGKVNQTVLNDLNSKKKLAQARSTIKGTNQMLRYIKMNKEDTFYV